MGVNPTMGPYGNEDWRNQPTLDSGLQIALDDGVFTGSHVTRPEVAWGWKYFQGVLTSRVAPSYVTFSFFMDPAETFPMGQRAFMIDPGVTGGHQLNMRCLASFLTLTFVSATPTTDFGFGLIAIGSNRDTSMDETPSDALLIAETGFAVPGGSGGSIYPLTGYAGPVVVTVTPDFGGGTVTLDGGRPDCTFQPCWGAKLGAANETVSFITIAPAGAWRLTIGGSGNVDVAVVPSLSGSS